MQVERDRIGFGKSVEQRREPRREQRTDAVGRVDVQPYPVLRGQRREFGQRVEGAVVSRAGRGDQGHRNLVGGEVGEDSPGLLREHATPLVNRHLQHGVPAEAKERGGSCDGEVGGRRAQDAGADPPSRQAGLGHRSGVGVVEGILPGQEQPHQVGDAAAGGEGSGCLVAVADPGGHLRDELPLQFECEGPALPRVQRLIEDARHQFGRGGRGGRRALHAGHRGRVGQVDRPGRVRLEQVRHPLGAGFLGEERSAAQGLVDRGLGRLGSAGGDGAAAFERGVMECAKGRVQKFLELLQALGAACQRCLASRVDHFCMVPFCLLPV